jgi:hypothetical protein
VVVALPFFSVVAIAFPFALNLAVTVPDLLLVSAKEGRVASVASILAIGAVILVEPPISIPPTAMAAIQHPGIGGSRAAHDDKQREYSYDALHR